MTFAVASSVASSTNLQVFDFTSVVNMKACVFSKYRLVVNSASPIKSRSAVHSRSAVDSESVVGFSDSKLLNMSVYESMSTCGGNAGNVTARQVERTRAFLITVLVGSTGGWRRCGGRWQALSAIVHFLSSLIFHCIKHVLYSIRK